MSIIKDVRQKSQKNIPKTLDISNKISTMKKQNTPTFADIICNTRIRKIKKTFFTQINSILNWDTISKKNHKIRIKKGVIIDASAVSTPLNPKEKILIIQWY